MKAILLSLFFISSASFAHHEAGHESSKKVKPSKETKPESCISVYEAAITLEYELTWGDLVPDRLLPFGYLETISGSVKWQELGHVYYTGKAYYSQAFDPYDECDDNRACYDMYKIDCDGNVTKYIDRSGN